jgi:hypothetical protein
MKNSDEAIERVLAGLREAEVPEGMEQRILDTMRDAAPVRREWRPMRLVMPSRLIATPSRAIAVAGVVVVLVAACWTAFKGQRIGHENARSKNYMVPANAPAPEVQVAAARAVHPLSGRAIARSSDLRVKTNARKAGPVLEGESAAQREMLSANHPAPEAPLTEEEKVLLRIAHRGDPVEMAALNQLLWAARDAEEKAEFQSFFEPPTTGDNK